ncbi:MAG: RAD55 family ATPase [Candidatus Helarchaeota archaeon]
MSCFKVSSKMTNIPILDVLLPEGIPNNNFIVLNGEPGTGKRVLVQQIIYNRLKMADPLDQVIYFTLEDSVLSKIQQLNAMGFNCNEVVKKHELCFIDGFSFRMTDIERDLQLKYEEDKELWIKLKSCMVTVNPTDLRTLLNKITTTVSNFREKIFKQNKIPTCILIIDSLTELMTINKKEHVFEFLKALRARVCKENSTQIIGINHVGVIEKFESVLSYFVDGIIDFRFDPVFMNKGILMKQFRIRKLSGAKSINLWLNYKIEKGIGITVPQKILKRIGEEFEELLKFEPKIGEKEKDKC